MPRRTVARSAELRGTGLFTGRACAVRVEPAPAGSGITFRAQGEAVPVHAAFRIPAPRRTTLASGTARIDTVEHLLATIVALEYDDLDLAVEGGEVPIGDGSFMPFVRLLEEAGALDVAGTRPQLVIDRELTIEREGGRYRIMPAAVLSLDATLEYTQPVIGRQRFATGLAGFRQGIAAARTFGFVAEIRRAQAGGEILGAAPETGIALETERVVNTTLRWPDEFVRHKVGDLIGDLALLGAPLRAAIHVVRPSHAGNFACVEAILATARFLEE